ncbi:30S ribosomal protein S16 [Enteractinococcus coprophilus]|uniref:Small ribosomal subunit protein bS16 n=1 Tax=Enteractinococcus coprophilus TaxID=1027633 RepID=A0A543AIM7_9MICC|nr:30S ribosomal protein S16 [Enteractinococcus coprophilus]TQL72432.1 SSU ribosomal protein S16P [Enteractinococcus coprophilus]
MAVRIRLKRFGKIRSPHYRVVVADQRAKRDGAVIEEIGIYHPTKDPSVIKIDSDRAQYWLGVGAQPSKQVTALLKLTGDWQKFKGEEYDESLMKHPAEKEAFVAPDKGSVVLPEAPEPKTEVAAAEPAEEKTEEAAE